MQIMIKSTYTIIISMFLVLCSCKAQENSDKGCIVLEENDSCYIHRNLFILQCSGDSSIAMANVNSDRIVIRHSTTGKILRTVQLKPEVANILYKKYDSSLHALPVFARYNNDTTVKIVGLDYARFNNEKVFSPRIKAGCLLNSGFIRLAVNISVLFYRPSVNKTSIGGVQIWLDLNVYKGRIENYGVVPYSDLRYAIGATAFICHGEQLQNRYYYGGDDFHTKKLTQPLVRSYNIRTQSEELQILQQEYVVPTKVTMLSAEDECNSLYAIDTILSVMDKDGRDIWSQNQITDAFYEVFGTSFANITIVSIALQSKNLYALLNVMTKGGKPVQCIALYNLESRKTTLTEIKQWNNRVESICFLSGALYAIVLDEVAKICRIE
jgi:hypothetical protein